MEARLLRRELLPLLLALTGLVVLAIAIDALLHAAAVEWIGRWLGIPGVLLIVGSFAYSLRKRKLISSGSPPALLRNHERLAWLGSLLVLVHAGVHFNSILAWLATLAMLVNIASGLTGKYLIDRSRRRLIAARERIRAAHGEGESIEDHLYWDSLTFDAIKQWRVVHFPITLAFGVLALAHVIAILLFWSWR
jgi:hypothetical protein